MTSLSFAVVLHASLLMTGADTYADAHKALTETGQPMVVVVGAVWCPACVEMEKTVIPQVRQRGFLQRVAFAAVDFDQEQTLGRQLTGGGPIPQLLMYRKTSGGWKLRRLIGGQTVSTVESFIQEGVAMDEETKRTESVEKTPLAPATNSVSGKPVTAETGLSESHG